MGKHKLAKEAHISSLFKDARDPLPSWSIIGVILTTIFYFSQSNTTHTQIKHNKIPKTRLSTETYGWTATPTTSHIDVAT